MRLSAVLSVQRGRVFQRQAGTALYDFEKAVDRLLGDGLHPLTDPLGQQPRDRYGTICRDQLQIAVAYGQAGSRLFHEFGNIHHTGIKQNIVDFLIAERFENMRGDPALVVQIAGDDLHGLLQRMLLRRQFFLDFLQMHLEHIVQQRINVLIVIIEGLAVDFAVVHNVLYRNLLQRLLL